MSGKEKQSVNSNAVGSAGTDDQTDLKSAIKRKKKPALLFGGLAVLWVILLNAFPMPFYSLFLASNVGSNVFLVFLAAVITFPANLLFSKIARADIGERRHLAINVVFMLAVVYTYSIFRYTAVWWVIISALLHCAATAVWFTKAKRENIPENVSKIKDGKSKGSLALLGVVCAAVSDFIYLLLVTLALYALLG